MPKRRKSILPIEADSLEGLEVLSFMLDTEADDLESGAKDNPRASDMFYMSVGMNSDADLRISHVFRTVAAWIKMIVAEIRGD